MVKYSLSKLADQDVEEMWMFGAQEWSYAQADQYEAGLFDHLEALVAGIAHFKHAIDFPGLLQSQYGSHVIFFKKTNGFIHVVRVLHGSRDPHLHL